MPSITISFTSVFIPDPRGRGYTGYFSEFSQLVAQGKTKQEVEDNLISSLKDIFNTGPIYNHSSF